jgi:hypothetical protein
MKTVKNKWVQQKKLKTQKKQTNGKYGAEECNDWNEKCNKEHQ